MIPVIVGVTFFLVAGVACIGWPEQIRDFGLMRQPKGFKNPFDSWMRTKAYIVSLRVIGVFCILSALILLLAANK